MKPLSLLLFFALSFASHAADLAAYVSIQNGKAVLSLQSSNGVGNFRVTGSTVTATNGAAAETGSEWVTAESVTTTRSDFTGFVGLYITNFSASAITATHLGRWVVSGNSQAHTIYVVDMSDLSVDAAVQVTTSGATAGDYAWGATNVVFGAGGTYALLTSETDGGDLWGDLTTTVTCDTSGGLANGPECYTTSLGTAPGTSYTIGRCYGPVNLRLQ